MAVRWTYVQGLTRTLCREAFRNIHNTLLNDISQVSPTTSHLVGEVEDNQTTCCQCSQYHFVCFVACMVHHTFGVSLGSVT